MDRRLRGFKTGSWIYPNLLNEKGAVFFSWTHGTVLHSVFRAEFFKAFFRSCNFLKSERTKKFFGEIRKRELRDGRRRKMKWVFGV